MFRCQLILLWVSLKILDFIYKTAKTWEGVERCIPAVEPGLREQHGKFPGVLFGPSILDLEEKMLALWTCQQTEAKSPSGVLSSQKTRKETAPQDTKLPKGSHPPLVKRHRKHWPLLQLLSPKGCLPVWTSSLEQQ